MKIEKNKLNSIFLIIITTLIFAIQDGLSFFLSINYNIFQIIMLRYWFLILIIIIFFSKNLTFKKNLISNVSLLHLLRGTILILEICFTVYCFKILGLTNSHSLFVTYPLITFIIAKIFLREKTSWKFYFAIILGIFGVFLIIKSKNIYYDYDILIPLFSSLLFSIYGVLTRYASYEKNMSINIFLTTLPGLLIITPLGLFYWEKIQIEHFLSILILCLISSISFLSLIKAYELNEITKLQPFAYLQSIFASIIGIYFFGENITVFTIFGAVIIIFAGLLVLKKN